MLCFLPLLPSVVFLPSQAPLDCNLKLCSIIPIISNLCFPISHRGDARNISAEHCICQTTRLGWEPRTRFGYRFLSFISVVWRAVAVTRGSNLSLSSLLVTHDPLSGPFLWSVVDSSMIEMVWIKHRVRDCKKIPTHTPMRRHTRRHQKQGHSEKPAFIYQKSNFRFKGR